MNIANVIDFRKEVQRRSTQRMSLLRAFKKYKVLNTHQITNLTGTGVSSRIHELRADHIIVTQYVKPGLFNYIYKGTKEAKAKREAKRLEHKVERFEDKIMSFEEVK